MFSYSSAARYRWSSRLSGFTSERHNTNSAWIYRLTCTELHLRDSQVRSFLFRASGGWIGTVRRLNPWICPSAARPELAWISRFPWRRQWTDWRGDCPKNCESPKTDWCCSSETRESRILLSVGWCVWIICFICYYQVSTNVYSVFYQFQTIWHTS